jgi:hypothetical protein
MKNFIEPNEEFPPINAKVFENYDRLDQLAKNRGYFPVEQSTDDKFETIGLVGLQNSSLHSGWVATADDYNIKALDQCQTLKAKITECLRRKEVIIIGFCQTGWFSVGYSIYRKENKKE